MDIKEIKSRLPILRVLAHYKIQVDKHQQILCPFHADGTPSCKIYPETNTFHCFGCGAKGDQIEFCAKMEGDKHKGILKATELAGENTGTGTNTMGIAECRGGAWGQKILRHCLPSKKKASRAALKLWRT